MRRYLTAFAAAALLITPASAETDWSAYGSFTATRCEDAKTIADILEALQGLTFNNGGGRTFADAGHVEITRSTTLRATENLLDCRIRIEAFEDGRWTTQFHPNY